MMITTMTMCRPVSISEKPMMMRMMLRSVSIPHSPIRTRPTPCRQKNM